MRLIRFLAPVLLAAAGSVHAAPWWSAFHDATLNLVLASAAPNAPQLELQAQLADDYVRLRAYGVRLTTARVLAGALQRQQDLLGADSEDARKLATLSHEAQSRVAQFERLRAQSLEALAAHAAPQRTPQEWGTLLEPLLLDTRPLLPDFELPDTVSGLVLRRRADVAAAEAELARDGRSSGAEQLRLARYLQALATPITADAQPQPLLQKLLAPEDVLQQARRDVAQRLALLAAREHEAREQLALMQKLQPAYALVDQAWRQGKATELQALQAYTAMLMEQDRMAAMNGQLALAWIAWQAGIGGAGAADASDLLGASQP